MEAAAAFRLALEELKRNGEAVERARAQFNLGRTLLMLGERADGTADLEASILAFRAALQDQPRARVPLAWASTQHNLGTALGTLGQRKQSQTHLEEAVLVLRSALEQRAKAYSPFAWVATQLSLGVTLRNLAAQQARAPCDAVANHWDALKRPLTPDLHNKLVASLELDLQSNPTPTPKLCPSLPPQAWTPIPRK